MSIFIVIIFRHIIVRINAIFIFPINLIIVQLYLRLHLYTSTKKHK